VLDSPLGDQLIAWAERFHQTPEEQLQLAVNAFLTLSQLTSPTATGLLPGDLLHMVRAGWRPTVIDVDDAAEYQGMRLVPSINIPLLELWDRAGDLPITDYLFVCKAGIRSRIAAGQWAFRHNRPAFFLEGGLVLWSRLGLGWEIDRLSS